MLRVQRALRDYASALVDRLAERALALSREHQPSLDLKERASVSGELGGDVIYWCVGLGLATRRLPRLKHRQCLHGVPPCRPLFEPTFRSSAACFAARFSSTTTDAWFARRQVLSTELVVAHNHGRGDR